MSSPMHKARKDLSPFGHGLDAPPTKRMKTRKIKLREVIDILQERGVEPIGALCDVLPNLDFAMQARTLLSLSEFVYPKLGRTVVVGHDGGAIHHTFKLNFG